ncbi:DUF3301 domain-containing protein [Thalassotalea maritima]|uniref:DUF3301 domain-containing protein n=1 Tax=Thalassotalea maritima TaxID=3242416 RepID=UPI00352892BA
MVLSDIYLLLAIALVVGYTFYIRDIAERARTVCQQYCKQHRLQYISIARQATRIACNKRRGIFIRCEFVFEFSGDGESAYQGTLIMNNKSVKDFILPPYKI